MVPNTPEVLSFATAECAFTLMLMAARRAEGERMVRAGKWEGWAPTQLLDVTVGSKKLGIRGFGRIGRELAGVARGFRMEIHYRDLNRLPPEQEQGAIFHENAGALSGRRCRLDDDAADQDGGSDRQPGDDPLDRA